MCRRLLNRTRGVYCDICDTDIGVCTEVCRIGLEGEYCDSCDTDIGLCADGCKIGLEGDYCDRCNTGTGICTDGCKMRLEGSIVTYVILTPVYVQMAVK